MRLLYGSILCAVTALYACDQNSVCFFVLLPDDVRNKIAYYLDFCETDQEFIARTRKYGEVSAEHKKLANRHDIKCMKKRSWTQQWGKLLYTYSVDCSKIIRLASSFNLGHCVTTTDIQSGTVTYENKLSTSDIYGCDICIAVSHGGTRVASFQRAAYQTGAKNGLCLDCTLVAAQVGTRTRKTFRVPSYYTGFISIGFNKQTTKLIVHARNDSQWDYLPGKDRPETFYYMESLSKPEVHKLRSTVTLDAYFYCRVICKPITSESVNGRIV